MLGPGRYATGSQLAGPVPTPQAEKAEENSQKDKDPPSPAAPLSPASPLGPLVPHPQPFPLHSLLFPVFPSPTRVKPFPFIEPFQVGDEGAMSSDHHSFSSVPERTSLLEGTTGGLRSSNFVSSSVSVTHRRMEKEDHPYNTPRQAHRSPSPPPLTGSNISPNSILHSPAPKYPSSRDTQYEAMCRALRDSESQRQTNAQRSEQEKTRILIEKNEEMLVYASKLASTMELLRIEREKAKSVLEENAHLTTRLQSLTEELSHERESSAKVLKERTEQLSECRHRIDRLVEENANLRGQIEAMEMERRVEKERIETETIRHTREYERTVELLRSDCEGKLEASQRRCESQEKDIALFEQRLRQQAGEVDSFRTLCADLEAKLDNCRKSLDKSEEDCQRWSIQATSFENELKMSKKDSDEAHRRSSTLEGELQACQRQLRKLEEELRGGEGRLRRQDEDREKLRRENTILERSIQELKNSLHASKEGEEKLRRENSGLERTIQELKNSLHTATERANSCGKDYEQLQRDMYTLKEQISILRAEIERAGESEKAHLRTIEELSEANRNLNRDYQLLQGEVNSLTHEQTRLGERAQALSNAKKGLEKDLNDISTALDEERKSHASTRDIADSQVDQIHTLQRQLGMSESKYNEALEQTDQAMKERQAEAEESLSLRTVLLGVLETLREVISRSFEGGEAHSPSFTESIPSDMSIPSIQSHFKRLFHSLNTNFETRRHLAKRGPVSSLNTSFTSERTSPPANLTRPLPRSVSHYTTSSISKRGEHPSSGFIGATGATTSTSSSSSSSGLGTLGTTHRRGSTTTSVVQNNYTSKRVTSSVTRTTAGTIGASTASSAYSSLPPTLEPRTELPARRNSTSPLPSDLGGETHKDPAEQPTVLAQEGGGETPTAEGGSPFSTPPPNDSPYAA